MNKTMISHYWLKGACGGWGTSLLPGTSRFWFPRCHRKLFIHIIFPATYWSWGPLSLYRNWVTGISHGIQMLLMRRIEKLTIFIRRFSWNLIALVTWYPLGVYMDYFPFVYVFVIMISNINFTISCYFDISAPNGWRKFIRKL